jgi:hypothetical protein
MTRLIKKYTRKGMGTVEIVIIIAVLVAIALSFRNALTSFADKLMDTYLDAPKVTKSIK